MSKGVLLAWPMLKTVIANKNFLFNVFLYIVHAEQEMYHRGTYPAKQFYVVFAHDFSCNS